MFTLTQATRFGQSRNGSTAIVFAVAAVPLLAVIGVGVDYSRAYTVQKVLQTAADSAVLAARGSGQNALQDAKAAAERIFEVNSANLPSGAVLGNVEVDAAKSGAEVKATATVPTTFSALLGFNEITVQAIAKATAASGDIEIALVLDNTGSMRNDMSTLKTAAKELVNKIYDSASNPSMVKISIVPYVGAVNIGNSSTQRSWMDTGVRSSLHGHEFAWHWFGYDPGCTHTSTGGGGGGPGTGLGGSDRQSYLDAPGSKYAFLGWMSKLFGIAPAQAAVPAPYLQDGCFIQNPGTINLFDLFDKIPNVSWKGCVEARQQPYDVDDTPPTTANGDTLFVPYFWPDEPDSSYSASITYNNNYLDDAPGLLPSPYVFEWTDGANWDWGRFSSTLKYNNVAATIDETAPDTKGPNAACPDELLPLTSSKSQVLSKIDSLSHWNGSGTVSSEGLMWGWRVLSPTEPFTEGKPYGEFEKSHRAHDRWPQPGR